MLSLRSIGLAQFLATLGTRTLVPVAGLVLAAVLALPVLSTDVPPLADYVNHLARMYVIAEGAGDPHLAGFYQIIWDIIPNLVMDLVVPPLVHLVGIYPAGQIFVLLTLAVILSGAWALHRTVAGQDNPLILLAFLFVLNNAFLYGFMNYLFGLGLALWGLAVDRVMIRRAFWQQWAVLGLFAALMFLAHLFAVGLFGLGLLAARLSRVFELPGGRLAYTRREFLLLTAIFAPLLPILAHSPTLGLAFDVSWDFWGKGDGFGWITRTYDPAADRLLGWGLIGSGALLALAGKLKIHRDGLFVAGLGLLIYALMPNVLFGSWAADLRLPVALALMILPFARLETEGLASGFAVAVIAILVVARVQAIGTVWQGLEGTFDQFRAAMTNIEPGSKILVADATHPKGNEAFNTPMSHAACLAIIERSALVTTAFSVQGKQVLSVREPFTRLVDREDGDPPSAQALAADLNGKVEAHGDPDAFWRGWAKKYDYVFLLYTAGDPNPAPGVLTLVHEGSGFQLYRVTPQQG